MRETDEVLRKTHTIINTIKIQKQSMRMFVSKTYESMRTSFGGGHVRVVVKTLERRILFFSPIIRRIIIQYCNIIVVTYIRLSTRDDYKVGIFASLNYYYLSGHSPVWCIPPTTVFNVVQIRSSKNDILRTLRIIIM